MIDINIIRNNPEIVIESLKKRKDEEKIEWVNLIKEKDLHYREKLKLLETLRQERNKATDEIRKLKANGKDVTAKLIEIKNLPGKIRDLQDEVEKVKDEIDHYMYKLPNLLHESVPYGKDDTENVEIKKYGKIKKFDFPLLNHGELAENNDWLDFKNAANISGKGFYFMKGDLALLNRALINFAIDKLTKKGYLYVEPPLMINKKVVEGVTDFEFFRDMVYKIEDEDLNLIGTSEHPIMGMFMNSSIKDLPIKIVSYSACFRKEIGSHGIDEKGIFRVHQFHKVEQVIISKPEESWNLFEEMLKNSEELFQELEIPYRVVNICTGDLGIVASKKYDIELWSPRQNKYREACSCSNCIDYQTRRLNIRHGTPGASGNPLAHSLNNTAIATSRVIIAILENFQNKDGSVNIPKVLIPYMNGKEKMFKGDKT
jgi:seryl-tRNA synthetase